MDNSNQDRTLTQAIQRIQRLEEELQHLRQRIDQLENIRPIQREVATRPITPETALELDLLNLPDNLRKTMLALARLREATPEEVAQHTNRTRGLENIYLNQLEMLGHIEKVKRGKRVYYRSLRFL